MNPRFINNLPVENFFELQTEVKSCRSIAPKRVELRFNLQGFAENFILQMAIAQAFVSLKQLSFTLQLKAFR
jgi:hypothetical protein